MKYRIERSGPRPGGPAAAGARLCGVLLALVLLAVCAPASAQKLAPSPTLVRLVNDNVAMLSDEQETALDARLSAYRRDTGTRIVLLTIASTAAESIEQYAGRVARDWSASHRDEDDVYFVIVARDNRPDTNRVRVQPGRGVRVALSEADMGRIVAEDVLPHFRVLDYDGGIVAGVERIESLLAGQAFPAPAPAAVPQAPPASDHGKALAVGVAVLLAALAIALPIRRVRSRRLVHLSGHRSLNRSFEPMIVGRFTGRPPKGDTGHDGNGFGGGFGGAGGFAGGGGDFSGGGATGFW